MHAKSLMIIIAAALPIIEAGAQPAVTGSQAPELSTIVAMSAADCRRFLATRPRQTAPVEHKPDAGVTYQPGVDAQVDVRGRPVAPADLPSSSPPVLGQTFDLELKFTLAELLGPRAGGYAQGKAGSAQLTVGRLQFDAATGQLRLGEERVENTAEDAVVKACRDHLAKPGKQ